MIPKGEFTARLTEQRSRFHALLVPAASEEEVRAVLDRVAREHRKARHHCWASRIVGPDGRVVEQFRDDGEVGKPGQRILELLRREDLEGLLVVSRYFGGVKLGPAGVGRAFAEVAKEAVSLAKG